MHLKGLNLNLLVVLDALLREKSVTKTAERLNVTQPAISAALQRLREYLEDPLLDRNGRLLELTHRAKFLAFPVREFLLLFHSSLFTTPIFFPSFANLPFLHSFSSLLFLFFFFFFFPFFLLFF